MTLRAVHAGTGYQYLLRSVATHDADPKGQSLSDYYAAKGTPPGRWIGSGLDGLDSGAATAGAVVTEAQMAALYGEGVHPDTDAKMLTGTALKDCKLGRSFPLYTGGVDVLDAIAAAERDFLKTEKRRPTMAERSEIAEQIGRPFYTEKFGYEHASGKDVIAWVNRERDQVKQAVAGFDFTFSPVKSVSVLWALADEQTSSKVSALHHESVAEALAWAEDNAIYTRVGKQGIEQVKTRGIVASEFTHFDTRGGDPDLHSHVLLANKVQGLDGRWLSLDGRAIFQMHQAISARYDAILHDKLTRRMGVEFTAHHPQPGKAPIWEIAGIDRRLIEMFSSRRTLARPVFEQLVAEYVEKNGRQPSQRASYALWQKAILDTRDAKKPAQSLDEHRAAWKQAATDRVGAEVVEQIVAASTSAEPEASREVFDPEQHTETVAELAIARVTDARAHFRASHLDTAISTTLKGYRFTGETELEAAHQAVMAHAMNTLVVPLTPPEPMLLPSALMTAHGPGIDRHANSEKYATDAVLNAETAVLEAARTPVAVIATEAAVDDVLAAHEKREGWSLNAGQQALAKHLVGVGTLVAAGVGPAGTGKTASMKIVAKTWQSTGRNVIGLAPSAAAASVLSEDIDAPAHTIDLLTFTWRGLNPNAPGKTLSALPVEIKPGDMLLVDEAGMASTENLAALTEIAAESGAVVRLIGDPYQLSAVTSGGLFADITRTPGTVELEQVMRMGADTEQAEATLRLRMGETDALDLYDARGWVTGGHREAMLTDAVQAYLADLEAGRSSLIIASRNEDVDTLNEVIRAGRVAEGIVDDNHTRVVSRGDTVGVGDTVIARKNSMLFSPDRTPLGRVINGQLFAVTGLAEDGSLAVRDRNTGNHMLIPADYAATSIHLGYAATIYRSQGATVDTTHAVIDTSVDRAGLYVAMTRGRRENRVYAVCEPVLDTAAEDGHMHSAGDHDAPTPTEVLHTVLARDTRQISAVETLRTEYADATDPERVEALYRHGAELAAKAFTARTLPDYLDALPRAYSPTDELGDEIAHAWTEAVLAGLDPRGLWAEATDNLEDAKSPAAVIAHRLRHQTREADTADELPAVAPSTLGTDTELTAWLADTRAALTEPDAAGSIFVQSYLQALDAEQGDDPDASASGPSWSWSPSVDSSPDLW